MVVTLVCGPVKVDIEWFQTKVNHHSSGHHSHPLLFLLNLSKLPQPFLNILLLLAFHAPSQFWR